MFKFKVKKPLMSHHRSKEMIEKDKVEQDDASDNYQIW